MPKFLSNSEIESLRISNFIFHVVHHGKERPILLDETPIGKFEDFFLDRIRETLTGNRFLFNAGATTLKLLREIDEEPTLFVQNTKQLAINFHALQDRRIKIGVLMVIVLTSGSSRFYSLIKFDHEQVLRYKLESDSRAILEEITNSFTKSKESLHKAALVRLMPQEDELIVIDQLVRHDISSFFKGFLNVKRKRTPEANVQKIALKTAKLHQSDLPQEILGNIRGRSYQAIQELEEFERNKYFNKAFGENLPTKIKETFDHLLREQELDGEQFRFEKEAVKPATFRRFETMEGVKIQYGEEAKDTVKISQGVDNKKTVVTITTDRLIEL